MWCRSIAITGLRCAGLARIVAAALGGIEALFEVAGRDHEQASAGDLGFVVGLNAAGRLDDMSLVFVGRVLCIGAGFAEKLHQLNRERRMSAIHATRRTCCWRATTLCDDVL